MLLNILQVQPWSFLSLLCSLLVLHLVHTIGMRHTLPSMALIPTYSTITPILYLVLRKSQGRQLRKNYNNITCSLKQ